MVMTTEVGARIFSLRSPCGITIWFDVPLDPLGQWTQAALLENKAHLEFDFCTREVLRSVVGKEVAEENRTIGRTGHQLTTVTGEVNTVRVAVVLQEPAGFTSGLDIPQSYGLVV